MLYACNSDGGSQLDPNVQPTIRYCAPSLWFKIAQYCSYPATRKGISEVMYIASYVVSLVMLRVFRSFHVIL